MTLRRRYAQVATALIIVVSSLAAPQPVEAGLSLAVDSTADTGDSLLDGICDDGFGACTLRAAMEEANWSVGEDTITFNIAGAGPHVIAPNPIPLPEITDPVIIDGYSQPGTSENTAAFGVAGDAQIKIEIDGRGVTTGGPCGGFLQKHGLCITANNSMIRGLAIYGFPTYGVFSRGNNNTIAGNYIGLASDGSLLAGNGSYGILTGNTASSPSSNTIIGGPNPGDRNVVAGNASGQVASFATLGSIIQGNVIGVDPSGTTDLTLSNGILVGANSTKSAEALVDSNLVSGTSVGIYVLGNSPGVVITSNRIGTDITGSFAIPNVAGGVNVFDTHGVTIGRPGEGNLISGNGGQGITISRSNNTTIQANLIGVNSSGTSVLGSGNDGIFVSGSGNVPTNNLIGGTGIGEGNLIAGSNRHGIQIQQTDGDVIVGNFIGVGSDGISPLGNGTYGIELSVGAKNSVIEMNTIKFNNGAGVHAGYYSATGNTITANTIDLNGGLGIDLPNTLLITPVVTEVRVSAGATKVTGSLTDAYMVEYDEFGEVVAVSSTPNLVLAANTTFTLDFYSSPLPDPSGSGEGALFLGTDQVTTDSVGNAIFSSTLPTAASIGHTITATMTGPHGQTSEFSNGIEATFLIETFEGISVTDTPLVQPSVYIQLTDTISINDLAVVRPPVVITLSEPVSVDDAAVVLPPIIVVLGEGIMVNDAVKLTPSITIEVSEFIITADTVDVQPTLFIQLREAIIATDIPTVSPFLFIQLGETITTTTDTPKVTLPIKINLNEFITTIDSPNLRPTLFIQLGETITSTDVSSVNPLLFIQLGETITATDEPTATRPVVITLGETITTTDTPSVNPLLFIQLSETITTTDGQQVAPETFVIIGVLEGVTITDSIRVDPSVPVTVSAEPTAETTTTEAGDEVTVSGSGFESDSEVIIELQSHPVLLGVTDTDEAGAFVITVTLPADSEPGLHHIVAIGVAPSGETVEKTAAVEVLPPIQVNSPVVHVLTGQPITTTLITTGGGDPLTTLLEVGSLPAGLSATAMTCSPTICEIAVSGTPTVPPGTYTTTIRASDRYLVASPGTFTLEVAEGSIGTADGAGKVKWSAGSKAKFTFDFEQGALDSQPSGSFSLSTHVGRRTIKIQSSALTTFSTISADPEDGVSITGFAAVQFGATSIPLEDYTFTLWLTDTGSTWNDEDTLAIEVRDPNGALVPSLTHLTPTELSVGDISIRIGDSEFSVS